MKSPTIHNPTTKNRQGWDISSQYRSLIAYHTPEHESFARESKEKLENSGKFRRRRIVTEIVPASTFYKAEDYHQKYYQKRRGGSCYRYSNGQVLLPSQIALMDAFSFVNWNTRNLMVICKTLG